MKYVCFIAFICATFMARAQDDDYVSLDERLKSNMFLKVEVSNTDCFVGEPIIATYKLYSALHSESSIVTNPSFKGFDVKHIKSEADETASRETVDGIAFDVHTILKVQLTPYNSGKLQIGTLIMRNNVKLIDANGNKDPILNGIKEDYSLSNGYYRINIASVPITVLVTALPTSMRSSSFKGTVGDFKMNVQLSKNIFSLNEQASLLITISGVGDFDKIKMPEINWPNGVETAPIKVDRDAEANGSGYISFAIPFTVVNPGKYTIPSIKFSFFDISSYDYKTITNIPIEFSVIQENASTAIITPKTNTIDKINMLLMAGALVALLLIIFLLIKKYKMKKLANHPQGIRASEKSHPIIENTSKETYVNNFLKPAEESIMQEGSSFYTTLKQCLIHFLEERYGLAAALFHKESLKDMMTANHIPADLQATLLHILTELDMNIYSGGGLNTDKWYLLQKARNLLLEL